MLGGGNKTIFLCYAEEVWLAIFSSSGIPRKHELSLALRAPADAVMSLVFTRKGKLSQGLFCGKVLKMEGAFHRVIVSRLSVTPGPSPESVHPQTQTHALSHALQYWHSPIAVVNKGRLYQILPLDLLFPSPHITMWKIHKHMEIMNKQYQNWLGSCPEHHHSLEWCSFVKVFYDRPVKLPAVALFVWNPCVERKQMQPLLSRERMAWSSRLLILSLFLLSTTTKMENNRRVLRGFCVTLTKNIHLAVRLQTQPKHRAVKLLFSCHRHFSFLSASLYVNVAVWHATVLFFSIPTQFDWCSMYFLPLLCSLIWTAILVQICQSIFEACSFFKENFLRGLEYVICATANQNTQLWLISHSCKKTYEQSFINVY